MMTSSGTSFNPGASATRLDIAVALVKALGHDAKAQALAGQPVTAPDGTPVIDNGQIPDALKGYVQIAINDGMFEAFPATTIETSPGVFQVIPGPRFEPGWQLTRATLAAKLWCIQQPLYHGRLVRSSFRRGAGNDRSDAGKSPTAISPASHNS